jgi:hypothetical protein
MISTVKCAAGSFFETSQENSPAGISSTVEGLSLGFAVFVIGGAMCSMKFGAALAAQRVLGNRLDGPAMRRIGCAMQNDFVIAECVKEARVSGVLWPTVNHKVEATPGLLARKHHEMVEAPMLSNEFGKTSLAKCNELIRRHGGRWRATKAGIVGCEVRSQAAPQGRPVPQVEGTAELMDGADDVLVVELVQHRFQKTRATPRPSSAAGLSVKAECEL